jgi:ribose transport system ATP-binding protein
MLVVSSDFEEVATLCARALVISRGRCAGQLQGAGLTVDELVARATLAPDNEPTRPPQPAPKAPPTRPRPTRIRRSGG